MKTWGILLIVHVMYSTCCGSGQVFRLFSCLLTSILAKIQTANHSQYVNMPISVNMSTSVDTPTSSCQNAHVSRLQLAVPIHQEKHRCSGALRFCNKAILACNSSSVVKIKAHTTQTVLLSGPTVHGKIHQTLKCHHRGLKIQPILLLQFYYGLQPCHFN